MIKNLFWYISLCLITNLCYGAQSASHYSQSKRASIKSPPLAQNQQNCGEAFAWYAHAHNLGDKKPCIDKAQPNSKEPAISRNNCGNLVLPCAQRISISQTAPSPSPVEVHTLGSSPSQTPPPPSPLQEKP